MFVSVSEPHVYTEPGIYNVTLGKGYYSFECWGASGGHDLLSEGSKGAFVSGYIRLWGEQQFFLFVGAEGQKNSLEESFNGGGGAFFSTQHTYSSSSACSGGGATDIRLIETPPNSFESLKSRILIAGGGGGEVNYNYQGVDNPKKGGDGGIINGYSGNYSKCINEICTAPNSHQCAEGGSQTSGGLGGGGLNNDEWIYGNNGTFGKGGKAVDSRDHWPSGGGGGGYYGGGSGGVSKDCLGSGAGGSSFISGLRECQALSKDATEQNPVYEGFVHYSGISFFNIKTAVGEANSHSGNGKIIITELILFTLYNIPIRIDHTLFFMFIMN